MASPRVIAITGASAGIGRAIAVRMARDGAAISLCARRADRLSEVAREINGQAIGDVTDPVTGQVIKAGQQLPGFAFLRDDGTVSD